MINVIVHHQKIEIVRSTHIRELLSGKELWELSDIPNEYFPPIVVVISDRERLAFHIRELIETFQKKILSPVMDLCAENHLFLDDLDL